MSNPLMIVSISDNPQVGEVCRDGFRADKQLSFHHVASIADFRAWAPGNAISALLVDMKTLVRSANEERRLIHDLAESLPVARVRFDAARREVVGTVDSSALEGEQLFGFISERVRTQRRARLIRRFPRRKTIFRSSTRKGMI